MRFPLQGAVVRETSYISLDDCFAALQIVLSRHSAKRVGGLSDDEAVASPITVSL